MGKEHEFYDRNKSTRPMDVSDRLGEGAIAGSNTEAYRTPKPRIGVGSVVKVVYANMPEEKATQTVWINEDKKIDAPLGARVISPQTSLAHALLTHNLNNGSVVSFEVIGTNHLHKKFEVEVLEIDGNPIA